MTDTQKDIVNTRVGHLLLPIFSDIRDWEEVTDGVMDDVVSDIECSADWSKLGEDEVCIDDIDIALARVLKSKIVGC